MEVKTVLPPSQGLLLLGMLAGKLILRICPGQLTRDLSPTNPSSPLSWRRYLRAMNSEGLLRDEEGNEVSYVGDG